jgi:hypothetical protein
VPLANCEFDSAQSCSARLSDPSARELAGLGVVSCFFGFGSQISAALKQWLKAEPERFRYSAFTVASCESFSVRAGCF